MESDPSDIRPHKEKIEIGKFFIFQHSFSSISAYIQKRTEILGFWVKTWNGKDAQWCQLIQNLKPICFPMYPAPVDFKHQMKVVGSIHQREASLRFLGSVESDFRWAMCSFDYSVIICGIYRPFRALMIYFHSELQLCVAKLISMAIYYTFTCYIHEQTLHI